MPSWITIYCRKPVADVTSAQLLKGITSADFDMLAEQFGLPEELVEPAAASLSVEEIEVIDGMAGLRLHYRPAGERQVDIERWVDPQRVAVEIDEALEMLEDAETTAAARVEEHLREVKAVVGIELGFGQLEDMGIACAFEVARWFADYADGIVRDDDDQWYHIEGGVLKPV